MGQGPDRFGTVSAASGIRTVAGGSGQSREDLPGRRLLGGRESVEGALCTACYGAFDAPGPLVVRLRENVADLVAPGLVQGVGQQRQHTGAIDRSAIPTATQVSTRHLMPRIIGRRNDRKNTQWVIASLPDVATSGGSKTRSSSSWAALRNFETAVRKARIALPAGRHPSSLAIPFILLIADLDLIPGGESILVDRQHRRRDGAEQAPRRTRRLQKPLQRSPAFGGVQCR